MRSLSIIVVVALLVIGCQDTESRNILEENGFSEVLMDEGKMMANTMPEKIEMDTFVDSKITSRKCYYMKGEDSTTNFLYIYDCDKTSSEGALDDLTHCLGITNLEELDTTFKYLNNDTFEGFVYKGKSPSSETYFYILDENQSLNDRYNLPYFMVVSENGTEPDLEKAAMFFEGVEFSSFY